MKVFKSFCEKRNETNDPDLQKKSQRTTGLLVCHEKQTKWKIQLRNALERI